VVVRRIESFPVFNADITNNSTASRAFADHSAPRYLEDPPESIDDLKNPEAFLHIPEKQQDKPSGVRLKNS